MAVSDTSILTITINKATRMTKIYATSFIQAMKYAIKERIYNWSYVNVKEVPFASNITYRVTGGIILCLERK